jgi:tRNA(His) 5'-end guanylyltransferase
MENTTGDLLHFTSCSSGYTQSDEITLFFPQTHLDNKGELIKPYFNLRVSKLISLTSSYCSVRFIYHLSKEIEDPYLMDLIWKSHFDARAYNLDSQELMVDNALWRYEDVYKNGANNLGHLFFSNKEMCGKRPQQVIQMLKNLNINYFDEHPAFRYGRFLFFHELFLNYFFLYST